MPSEIVKGLRKLDKRLSEPTWVAKPAGSLLRTWRMDMRSEIVERAPEWKRNLKKSFETQQDTSKFPLWARVYSDNPAARWTNWGTGILSIDPQSKHQRYFPPPRELADWSAAHDLNPYAVAYGIWRRGGIAPLQYIEAAEHAADAKLNHFLAQFADGIAREAAHGS